MAPHITKLKDGQTIQLMTDHGIIKGVVKHIHMPTDTIIIEREDGRIRRVSGFAFELMGIVLDEEKDETE